MKTASAVKAGQVTAFSGHLPHTSEKFSDEKLRHLHMFAVDIDIEK